MPQNVVQMSAHTLISLRFHKILEISEVIAEILAFEKAFCSTRLVSLLLRASGRVEKRKIGIDSSERGICSVKGRDAPWLWGRNTTWKRPSG